MTGRLIRRVPTTVFGVDDFDHVTDPDGVDLVWTRSTAGVPITATGDAARALTDLVEGDLWAP